MLHARVNGTFILKNWYNGGSCQVKVNGMLYIPELLSSERSEAKVVTLHIAKAPVIAELYYLPELAGAKYGM